MSIKPNPTYVALYIDVIIGGCYLLLGVENPTYWVIGIAHLVSAFVHLRWHGR